MNIVEHAKAIACDAHKNHFRMPVEFLEDQIQIPYIVHPQAVAMLTNRTLINLDHDFNNTQIDEIIAAAWLHDVVEDSNITFNILTECFPDNPMIITILQHLTDSPNMKGKSRKVRKAAQKEKVNSPDCPIGSKIIKIWDQFDNCITHPKPEYCELAIDLVDSITDEHVCVQHSKQIFLKTFKRN